MAKLKDMFNEVAAVIKTEILQKYIYMYIWVIKHHLKHGILRVKSLKICPNTATTETKEKKLLTFRRPQVCRDL